MISKNIFLILDRLQSDGECGFACLEKEMANQFVLLVPFLVPPEKVSSTIIVD